MEKKVNINKAPKDDVLNTIMQEIDDEQLNTPSNTPPKIKKPSDKKTSKPVKAKAKKTWGQWFVYFVFSLMAAVFIFILVLILKSTEEIVENQEQTETITEHNESNTYLNTENIIEKDPRKENSGKVQMTEPLEKEVSTRAKKIPDNLIILDMRKKKESPLVEQAPYVPLKGTQKVLPPLSDREKAKAKLKAQMQF